MSNNPDYSTSTSRPYNDYYNFGGAAYIFLVLIIFLTIILISYEIQRRKYVSLINRGYFFVEQFVSFKRKQWVPVPPENVDTSNAMYPRIINSTLIQPQTYVCCT